MNSPVRTAVVVADEEALVTLVDTVEQDIGPVDLFVSNAGVAFGDGESGAISAEGGLNPVADRRYATISGKAERLG